MSCKNVTRTLVRCRSYIFLASPVYCSRYWITIRSSSWHVMFWCALSVLFNPNSWYYIVWFVSLVARGALGSLKKSELEKVGADHTSRDTVVMMPENSCCLSHVSGRDGVCVWRCPALALYASSVRMTRPVLTRLPHDGTGMYRPGHIFTTHYAYTISALDCLRI